MIKTALTVIFCSSVLLACRKNDLTTPPNDPRQAINKFFTLPNITNPAVARIAQKLQTLHDRTGFVQALIEKDGYALWEKALINLPARSGRSTNTANNADTIIYIPLMLDNTDYVDAFICAKLGDSIQLQLHRGREYASYGFGSLTDTANNAEKLAVQLMLLNESSFGHKDFKLLDDRLLKDGSLPPTARTRNRMAHVEPANTAQRSGFQTVQYEVCTSTQYLQCTSNHACCPDGSCSGCQAACWHTNTQCQTVSVLVYIDNGNWGLGDGGNNGGGGSGGGIINTNGPQPCNPTPLLDNGLLPCELGNNTGWAPIITEYIPTFNDYATPPFIWTFIGDDNTTFDDLNSTNEPSFQFDPIDNYEVNYPRFANMVKKLKTFVKNNPKALSALQRYSGFTKQQILNHLTFGQGPIIKIEEMNGRFGYYNKNNGANTLHLRASYVRGLEQSFLPSTQEATAFLLAVTILHEYVHLGTTQNGISEGVYDFGYGFERDAFNVIVDEDNAANVVIKFSNYF